MNIPIILTWLAPFIVLLGGMMFQKNIKGYRELAASLGLQKAKDPAFKTSLLYTRAWGYNYAEVLEHMQALQPEDRATYLRLLRWDLIFPLLYGVSLIWALHVFGSLAGESLPELLLWLPIVAMLADWTENFLLGRQVVHYAIDGSLNKTTIRIASFATNIKFIAITASLVLLIFLGIAVL